MREGDFVRSLLRQLMFVTVLTLVCVSPAVAGSNKIYFRNDTDETLWTAVAYCDIANNWIVKGYYRLEPGQSRYVALTNQRRIYVWAKNADGDQWSGGRRWTVPYDGKVKNFRSWDTGPKWGSFTYSFHW